MSATIDENRRLHLDRPLPVAGPGRVQVIFLFPEPAEIDEQAGLKAAASNPAFDFLGEPAEDIHTPADGKPFHG